MSDDLPPGTLEPGGPWPGEEEEPPPIPTFDAALEAAAIALRCLAKFDREDGDDATFEVRITDADVVEVHYVWCGGSAATVVYMPDAQILGKSLEELVEHACNCARLGARAAEPF